MRDRLIGIFRNTNYQNRPNGLTANLATQFTDYSLNEIVDALLANGVIVPPCKVGDTVYVLTIDSPTGIEKSRVKRMSLQELQDGTTIRIIVPCVYDDWGNAIREFYPEDFGKTVFLTQEEAERALAERRSDNE